MRPQQELPKDPEFKHGYVAKERYRCTETGHVIYPGAELVGHGKRREDEEGCTDMWYNVSDRYHVHTYIPEAVLATADGYTPPVPVASPKAPVRLSGTLYPC